MGWASAFKERPKAAKQAQRAPLGRPSFPLEPVDWAHLVSLDFETHYGDDYTLSKLSTSEYIRDPRFQALMVGIKIGNGKTKVVPGHKVQAELRKIPWTMYSLLCHNAHFDGLILSHHYGVKPKKYYCSLSMARGLFSNDIGAGLDEVAQYLGGEGKLASGTEDFKGFDLKRLLADKPRYERAAQYCGQDVDEMLRIFKIMHSMVPRDEMDLIHVICRMFCDPVLRVDIPRVKTELAREIAERRAALLGLVDEVNYAADIKKLLKNTAERELVGDERKILLAKRVVGSSERFADLIRAEGVEPPIKLSAAWMKKPASERSDDDKWTYAFAKDDHEFINLPDQVEDLSVGLNLNKKADIAKLAARQERLRALVDARLAVKSTTNITRAERFLVAGAKGMPLPVGYAYYRAHTGRLGGANKMNMQNLKRGGELRKSILAPLNHVVGVVDSGQIEARVNAWLWGQDDLLDAFRAADGWDKDTMGVAHGDDRDAYCKFGDLVYGREITTDDKTERFVGKVCFAADTLVLTNHGLKPIIEVRSNDYLWDGVEWVMHDGLILQGEKAVLRAHGLAATADHAILTERGWQAWSVVHTDPLLFQSALCLANSPSLGGTTTPLPKASFGDIALSAAAAAAPNQWSTLQPCVTDEVLGATHAPSEQPARNGTGSTVRQCLTKATALVCSTASRLRSAVAQMRATLATNTMVRAASALRQSGSKTALSSCATSNACLVGTTPSSTWTDATQMATTSRATFVSLRAASTPATSAKSVTCKNASLDSNEKTLTYDLANAGPRHRFAVWTDQGLVIAHNCVLGLGYQMGAPKLQITLAKGALGGPPVYFELDKCHAIVNAYRRKNHRIQWGWEKCAEIIEDMAVGRAGSWGPITWEQDTIWLPNGMALKYPDLKKRQGDKGWDEWTYQGMLKGTPVRKKIYGGLLCENIVQALARIIVMGQLLQIDTKYRVVMTTHDENVAVIKKASAETAMRFMMKVMRTPPAWCADIPLNAEGGYAENYSK